MTVFTQGRAAAEFILAEANGNRSRDNLKIGENQDFEPGTILGVVASKGLEAASAVKSGGANTGNGTITLDATTPVLPGAQQGKYTIRCIATASNGGNFRVENPDGDVIGDVAVGATFADDIKFVINDGSADYAVGDGFDITVTESDEVGGVEEFGELDPSATNGLETAAAIAIYGAKTGEDESTAIAGITRDCTVNGKCLGWPDGITAAQKGAAIAKLAEVGIIVR